MRWIWFAATVVACGGVDPLVGGSAMERERDGGGAAAAIGGRVIGAGGLMVGVGGSVAPSSGGATGGSPPATGGAADSGPDASDSGADAGQAPTADSAPDAATSTGGGGGADGGSGGLPQTGGAEATGGVQRACPETCGAAPVWAHWTCPGCVWECDVGYRRIGGGCEFDPGGSGGSGGASGAGGTGTGGAMATGGTGGLGGPGDPCDTDADCDEYAWCSTGTVCVACSADKLNCSELSGCETWIGKQNCDACGYECPGDQECGSTFVDGEYDWQCR